jgi:hypothetical protein
VIRRIVFAVSVAFDGIEFGTMDVVVVRHVSLSDYVRRPHESAQTVRQYQDHHALYGFSQPHTHVDGYVQHQRYVNDE